VTLTKPAETLSSPPALLSPKHVSEFLGVPCGTKASAPSTSGWGGTSATATRTSPPRWSLRSRATTGLGSVGSLRSSLLLA
jgi:hypothetical protein